MKPKDHTPHPTSEQWADFLYGEAPPAAAAELQRHLDQCPACQSQIQDWRRTTRMLDSWKIPGARPKASLREPTLRWAIAALLLLCVGLAAGRLSNPRLDPDQVRAQLVPALRQELRQDFESTLQTAMKEADHRADLRLQQLVQAWSTARAEDQNAVLALYQKAERQRKADVASLRRDLETVAINADARLDTTQRSLGQLLASSESLSDRSTPILPANLRSNERNP